MTRLKYELTCQAPDCGKKFLATKASKETCSTTCHMRLMRKRFKPRLIAQPTCLLPSCQEIVTSAKVKLGRPKLYCCDEHMKRHHYLNNFGLTEKERDATCPNPLCHNPSFVKHHGRQIYCSKACGTEHRRVKNYPVVEDVKPVNFHHLCNYCGTEYGAARSSAQFCSTSCRVMFNKQDRMAEWVNKRMTFNADDHLYDELDGEIFIECEFNNFDFSGKSLTKAKFINCVINNCCFDKTFFDGVELIDTDFEGYNTFRGALVRFTKFPLVSETVLDLSGIIESKVKRSVLLKVQREKLENKRISFYE